MQLPVLLRTSWRMGVDIKWSCRRCPTCQPYLIMVGGLEDGILRLFREIGGGRVGLPAQVGICEARLMEGVARTVQSLVGGLRWVSVLVGIAATAGNVHMMCTQGAIRCTSFS